MNFTKVIIEFNDRNGTPQQVYFEVDIYKLSVGDARVKMDNCPNADFDHVSKQSDTMKMHIKNLIKDLF